MIQFDEKTHTYKSKDKKFLSVTQLIKKFKSHFDQKYWSTYKALETLVTPAEFQFMKKWGRGFVYHFQVPGLEEKRKEILEQWRKKSIHATQRGTRFHNAEEQKSIDAGEVLNTSTGKTFTTVIDASKGKISLAENLYELEDGFYPELLVWNGKYSIAGKPDRVFIETIEGKRFIDIEDFKTNEKIKLDNYFQKMKRPLLHLDCCNYNHYNLQISAYAWLLEDFGFVPRHLSFDHHKEAKGEAVRYNLPYLKKEILDMLATLPPPKI